MKINNQILCKKNHSGFSPPNKISFTKNKIYHIEDIHIYTKHGHDPDILKTITRYKIINSNNNHKYFYDFNYNLNNYIWDYFYTQKEYRKLKLQKLNQ